LEELGVEIFGGPMQMRFSKWLSRNAADIDCILLSRPSVATKYLADVKRLANAKLVYYGHDIHFARMRLEAQIANDAKLGEAAAVMEETERELWRSVDLVLYPSDEEIETVCRLENDVNARSLVPFRFGDFMVRDSPPPGATIIFVAGFGHAPNVNAAEWFVKDVFPQIRVLRKDARLSLVGSDPTPAVQAL
jgi:O-antigen biosynthesis protein